MYYFDLLIYFCIGKINLKSILFGTEEAKIISILMFGLPELKVYMGCYSDHILFGVRLSVNFQHFLIIL